jgi:hypothetical protein
MVDVKQNKAHKLPHPWLQFLTLSSSC